MKALIIAACLFLLLGVANIASAAGQKEPTYPPYCWVQPTDNKLWYVCGSEEAKAAQCLQLMETAMHNIDPYLKFLDTGLPQFSPEQAASYKQAIHAWERIKHMCWKEFEEERLQGEHLH